jgi:hypothetical protein
MAGYRYGRNSADDHSDIPFEISKEFPQRVTIYDRIDLEWVSAQVRKAPLVTLKGLSTLIQKRFGVTPSISHMDRIQQLAGISRIPGSRAKRVTAV